MSNSSNALVKSESTTTDQNALTRTDNKNGSLIGLQKIKRTSDLPAPIMHLTNGHTGEIFTCKFDPTGDLIASAGFERSICLWNTFGECNNFGKILGHKGAILELDWSHDSNHIYTASSDHTVGLFDITTGTLVKRFKSHSKIVNSVYSNPKFAGYGEITTGSDDGTIKVWDINRKLPGLDINLNIPITSVTMSHNGDRIFASCLDDTIKVIDIRNKKVMEQLVGHNDTITGIQLSKDGNSLISYAMDNLVMLWDVKPFCSGDRLKKHYAGSVQGFERNLLKPSISPTNQYIACGGGDRNVTIFDVSSSEIVYKLPGHKGTVNQVHFHPNQPILLSGSTDSSLFLGELQ